MTSGCKTRWRGSRGDAERCRRRARITSRSSAAPRQMPPSRTPRSTNGSGSESTSVTSIPTHGRSLTRHSSGRVGTSSLPTATTRGSTSWPRSNAGGDATRGPRDRHFSGGRGGRSALRVTRTPMAEVERKEYVDACLALAFGHIEIDGACSEWVRRLALDAIGLDRRGIESLVKPWAQREERLARLVGIERALVDAPSLGEFEREHPFEGCRRPAASAGVHGRDSGRGGRAASGALLPERTRGARWMSRSRRSPPTGIGHMAWMIRPTMASTGCDDPHEVDQSLAVLRVGPQQVQVPRRPCPHHAARQTERAHTVGQREPRDVQQQADEEHAPEVEGWPAADAAPRSASLARSLDDLEHPLRARDREPVSWSVRELGALAKPIFDESVPLLGVRPRPHGARVEDGAYVQPRLDELGRRRIVGHAIEGTVRTWGQSRKADPLFHDGADPVGAEPCRYVLSPAREQRGARMFIVAGMRRESGLDSVQIDVLKGCAPVFLILHGLGVKSAAK